MSRMLILQLERFGRLSSAEKLALAGTIGRPRGFPPRLDLPREEDRAGVMNVLLAGYACRYAVLPSGRRQILAYLLPGEPCDQRAGQHEVSDHCLGTLTAVSIASFPREELACVAQRFPRIARAFELMSAAEQATMRQWLLSLGHRSALERTAHLLCELFTRLRAIGLAGAARCELPLRQVDLADALALSSVHMNRTLAQIRHRKLAIVVRRQLFIDDLQALQSLCGFRPHYLFGGCWPAVDDRRGAVEAADEEAVPAAVEIRSGTQLATPTRL